jgi:archaellum biogenesis ATPase FlaH
MITANNYFNEVERIGVDTLPETLKKGHDLVVKSTNNGTSWSNYQSSESIRKVIDLYFKKLNDYVSSIGNKQPIPAPEPHAHKQSIPKTEKVKVKNEKASAPKKRKATIESQQKVKLVEHLREEIKFIRRYIGLHNKMKTPNAILTFIKALQRSIVQKLIRKTSPLADEIEMIQNKLVQAYNKMKGEESFAINEKDLHRLVAIAGGEKVYPSITVIKRFIGLQGKDDEKKINAFLKYLENLADKKKITKDDPYADKLKTIYKAIKQRTSSKIAITKAELNGLEGIVKACGCKDDVGKIYDTNGKKLRQCRKRTYSDASRGACSHNKGLNGVLTAEEMANRELDLLPFFSFWHSLFGSPARNFTMMLHGEPHNGKTIFLLKFAQFLSGFGNVLYVSSEEFASPTMTNKVNEFLNPLPKRLHFAENLKDPNLSLYQFVILDSVNDLGLKINEYKEMRKEHPDTAFIFILQHTKAGDFRGGKDWEHIAEIAGEVHKGVVTISKNRYASKASLDFFNQSGIQWQEPMDKQNLKPYPVKWQYGDNG